MFSQRAQRRLTRHLRTRRALAYAGCYRTGQEQSILGETMRTVNLWLTRRFALPELPLRCKEKRCLVSPQRELREREGEAPAEPKPWKRVLVLLGVYS